MITYIHLWFSWRHWKQVLYELFLEKDDGDWLNPRVLVGLPIFFLMIGLGIISLTEDPTLRHGLLTLIAPIVAYYFTKTIVVLWMPLSWEFVRILTFRLAILQWIIFAIVAPIIVFGRR